MAWPLSQDYNEAVQNPRSSFSDAELRNAEAVSNAMGIPIPRSGNFADVYEFRSASGGHWAVKCFTRQVSGLSERYGDICRYLRLAKLPFTVDFQYLEQGIRVRGQWYPILKMQWVEGLLLNEFVRANLDKPALLQALGQIWLRMAKRLREANVAHCDLQHGNVVLVPGSTASSLAVKLIDYDGMFVPTLAGTSSGEVGHPAFQHPERLRTGQYSLDVDRFPLLLVATALMALKSQGSSLWAKYDNGDNLLFRRDDLNEPKQSPLFAELKASSDPLTAALTAQLLASLEGKLESAPLLEDLMPEARPTLASSRAPSKTSTAAATAATGVFQNIKESAEEQPARRRTTRAKRHSVVPWLVGGGLAALVLVGGLLALAFRDGPEKPKDEARIAQKKPEKAPQRPKKPKEPVAVPGEMEAQTGKPAPIEVKIQPAKVVKADGPVDEEWLKSVAALPALKQVEAVAKKLQKLNPGFDGRVKYTIKGDVVTHLEFVTEHVTDLSPVRASTGLRRLICGSGSAEGRLTDLSPLKDMKLTGLDLRHTRVSDLSPLKNLPLTYLICDDTKIADLSLLKDMKLLDLSCANTKVADLSPLKDMKLESLGVWGTQVSDLSLLKNMKLRWLSCKNSRVSDLSPLKDMSLKEIYCNFKPERDAAILRSIKTLERINDKPAAVFWAEVKLPPESPAKPAEKPAEPVVENPPRKPADGKSALPSDDAVEAAVKDVQSAFPEDYARQTSKGRQDLAAKLLEEGRKSKDDPVKRFALYREARDLAARGAAPALSVEAAEEMAKAYPLDPLESKVTALKAAGKAVDAPPIAKAYLQAALPLLKDAWETDQYDAVAPLSQPSQLALRFANDAELKRTVGPLLAQLEQLRKQYDGIKDAVQVLKEKPDDPSASLAVGRFLCFHKKTWEKGLPLLGKGDDKAVADAAEKDRAQPKDAAAQLVLGDAWYDLAKAQADVRPTLQRRACEWYVRALVNLNGEDKARVEKRVVEMSKSYPEMKAAWSGLDISQAVVVGNAYLRLQLGRTLAIKKPVGGQVEVVVVCRTAKPTHFEMLQEKDVFARWELKTANLGFHRLPRAGKGGRGWGAGFDFTPDRWYTFILRLTDESMEAILEGRNLRDKDRASPAKAQIFAIRSLNETMEIRSFTVKPINP